MYKNLNFLEAFEELSNIQDENALQEDREQKRWDRRLNKATKDLDSKTTEWITAILNCEWDLGSETTPVEWHSTNPNSPNFLPLPHGAAEDPNIVIYGDRWKDENSGGTLDFNEKRDRVKSNITKNPKNIRDLDLTVHEKLRKNQELYDTFFDVSPNVLSIMDKKEAERVLQSEYGVSRSSVLKLIHEILLCCK
jgi:hypothetical protein